MAQTHLREPCDQVVMNSCRVGCHSWHLFLDRRSRRSRLTMDRSGSLDSGDSFNELSPEDIINVHMVVRLDGTDGPAARARYPSPRSLGAFSQIGQPSSASRRIACAVGDRSEEHTSEL